MKIMGLVLISALTFDGKVITNPRLFMNGQHKIWNKDVICELKRIDRY